MLAVFKFANVLADGRATNASVTLHIHVVAQSKDDRLDLGGQFTCGGEDEGLCLPNRDVDGLQDGDREGGSFTSSGLCLRDDIPSLDNGQYGTLLDSGRLFKV